MEVLFRLSVLDLQQRGVSERAAITAPFIIPRCVAKRLDLAGGFLAICGRLPPP